jgi:hypothetical protein
MFDLRKFQKISIFFKWALKRNILLSSLQVVLIHDRATFCHVLTICVLFILKKYIQSEATFV